MDVSTQPETILQTLFLVSLETLDARARDLGADKVISELGLDSRATLRFLLAIQDRFGVIIAPDWFLEKNPTFGELALHLYQQIVERPHEEKKTPFPETQVPPKTQILPEPQNPVPPKEIPEVQVPLTQAPQVSVPQGDHLAILTQQMRAMYSVFAAQWKQLGLNPPPFPLPDLAEGKDAELLPELPEPPELPKSTEPSSPTPEPQPAVGEGTSISPLALGQVPLKVEKVSRIPPQLTAKQESFVNSLLKRLLSRLKHSEESLDHQSYLGLPGTYPYLEEFQELAFPLLIKNAGLSRFLDVDGNSYLDFSADMGFWGHNPPQLTEAINSQLEQGISRALNELLALKLAETAVPFLYPHGKVTFFETPDTAARAALRLARAVTGKSKVLSFSRLSPGLSTLNQDPESAELRFLDYGPEKSLIILKELARESAGVIVAAVDPRNLKFQSGSYLGRIRRITQDAGVPLILDETPWGPAFLPGGTGAYWGITPDLALYGSSLTGGLPIGILAGKPEILDILKQRNFWENLPLPATFQPASTLALAALEGALHAMADQGAALMQERIRDLRDLSLQLNLWFQEKEVPLRLISFGPFFAFVPYGPLAAGEGSLELELFYLLLGERGIHVGGSKGSFNPRLLVLSATQSREDIRVLKDAVFFAISALREGGFPMGPGKGSPKVVFPLESHEAQGYLDYEKSSGNFQGLEILAFHLEGPVSLFNLETGLRELVSRHTALNTGVWRRGENLYFKLENELPLNLRCFKDLDSDTPWWALKPLLAPLDLRVPPLLRAGLIDRGDQSLFALVAPAAALDRESLKILLLELRVLMYRGNLPPLAPDPFLAKGELAGYLGAKNERGITRAQESLAYWTKELNSSDITEIPLDNPLLKNSGRTRTHYQEIGGKILSQVREKIRSSGFSPTLFWVGVMGLALQKFTQGESFLITRKSPGRVGPLSYACVGALERAFLQKIKVKTPDYLAELFQSDGLARRMDGASIEEIARVTGQNTKQALISHEYIPGSLYAWPRVKSEYVPLISPGTEAIIEIRLSEE
ncbi:MAG: aminotransferase class III-fold pyridoxal phosphate-dependent enzyme, partial [Deltaproteobacteria bacterium]|nr:aminotransferase class III-fold pyridoxal phosphate-dependent enzyme [Deltaproteobacteria bacterium]